MTPNAGTSTITLTRVHKVLIGTVAAGAVVIAGSASRVRYAAVRELALQKGFGNFSYVFPIGIDAGICVLLALDLLLTWIRIPFPLLRQTAWLLTAATIAFNGAAAWPDPLGVGMHAVIPILFVVSVEAARHAVGRIADITADKHMEGVRLTRWLLSPVPTFLLWRRMKLWELRSYEQVIKLEQERLVYQARLRSRFGRAWRRKAPVESLMPLRLARYGVPLAETAPRAWRRPASRCLRSWNVSTVTRRARNCPRPSRSRLWRSWSRGRGRSTSTNTTARTRWRCRSWLPVTPRTNLRRSPHSLPRAARGVQVRRGRRVQRRIRPVRATAGQQADGGCRWSAFAARGDWRPAMVQARIDRANWLQRTRSRSVDEAVLSPIGDSPEPVPVPESEPVPVPVPVVMDESVDAGAEPEPTLTGKALLEHLYLQLPPEQRYPHTSASALAREWHEAAGFTEGSARKYLGDIIRKHS